MTTVSKKKILIYLIVCFLYTVNMIAICRCIAIDSDKANHLLQAADILKGNIFLRDWNLTGVTFLTTDLIYYEIAELIFGVSNRAIYVSGGLMIASAMIAAYFTSIIGINDDRKYKNIFLLILLSIPCTSLAKSLRVHTGAVFLSFCIVLLYYLIFDEKKNNNCYIILLAMAIFLGTFGDLLTVIDVTMPIILFSFYKVVNSYDNNKKNLQIIGVASASTLIAFIFQRIYFFIGKANPNSYIGDKCFTPVSEWGDKFLSFLSSLMRLSMSDFSGEKMSDIWAVVRGVYFIFLLLELALIITIVVKMIKGLKVDTISGMLSLSCCFTFLAYMFTEMSESRYITIIPLAGIAVLVRNADWIYSNYKKKKLVKVMIIILACVGISGKFNQLAQIHYPRSTISNYKLIDFLREKNLTYGYASFWNSSNLTVLSKEEIKIRHIVEPDSNTYYMYNWFNKNSWYSEPTNFVLINNCNCDEGKSDTFGLNVADVTDFWGEPDERYDIEGYIVLVYNKNLSETLGIKKNAIDDGEVSFDEMSINANAEIEDEQLILHEGGISFGPYDTIEPGTYKLTYEGENLMDATFDIFSKEVNGKNIFDYSEVTHSGNKIDVNLKVDKKIEDIEFRLYNNTTNDIVLDRIIIN